MENEMEAEKGTETEWKWNGMEAEQKWNRNGMEMEWEWKNFFRLEQTFIIQNRLFSVQNRLFSY